MEESAKILRIKRRIVLYISSEQKECNQCEIYREVVGRRTDIARVLSLMVDENILSCVGDGVRSDPRRYSLKQTKNFPPDKSVIDCKKTITEATDFAEVLI